MVTVSGDIHHIFPREYLKQNGFNDKKLYNQVANYVYLDTGVNISIGKRCPNDYFNAALAQCKTEKLIVGTIINEPDFYNNLTVNCIPHSIINMTATDYHDFLIERRKQMALKIKSYYYSL